MIPAPVLFGVLIDRACLAWQQQPCNSEKGSCFTYDNGLMGTYFLTLVFCCKGLSLLFFVIALLLYRPPLSDSGVVAVEVCNSSAGNSNASSWSSPSSHPLLNSNGMDAVHGYPPSDDNRENERTEKDIWVLHSILFIWENFVRIMDLEKIQEKCDHFPHLRDYIAAWKCVSCQRASHRRSLLWEMYLPIRCKLDNSNFLLVY